jgi:hypothetical protein
VLLKGGVRFLRDLRPSKGAVSAVGGSIYIILKGVDSVGVEVRYCVGCQRARASREHAATPRRAQEDRGVV